MLWVKVDLCSAASFKSSRQELSIDMAEHRSILKNNQNTYPRFSYTPKTGVELPEMGILFSLCPAFSGKSWKSSTVKSQIHGVDASSSIALFWKLATRQCLIWCWLPCGSSPGVAQCLIRDPLIPCEKQTLYAGDVMSCALYPAQRALKSRLGWACLLSKLDGNAKRPSFEPAADRSRREG